MTAILSIAILPSPLSLPSAVPAARHQPPTPPNFFETEFKFRSELIGLKSARQSGPRRLTCGTMTAVFDF
jgi:hypothetical protein